MTPCSRCVLALEPDPEAVEDEEFCSVGGCERIGVTALRIACRCRIHQLVVACAGHQQDAFDQMYDWVTETNDLLPARPVQA